MMTRIFLMFVGLSLATFSHAQNNTELVVGKSERLMSLSNLKEQADKVNQAHQVYQQQLVTGTRSSSVNAKSAYDLALLDYQNELERLVTLKSSADYLTEINAEIALVKELRKNLNPTESK